MRLIPTITRIIGKAIPLRWASRHDAYFRPLKSSPFAREVAAVDAGRLRFEAERNGQGGNRTLLRRNTHRLEKALIMRPRRTVFAAEFIGETVATYAKLVNQAVLSATSDSLSDQQRALLLDVEYADAVLRGYFDAVNPVDEIGAAKEVFGKASAKFARSVAPVRQPLANVHVVPFRRQIDVPAVEFERLKELAFNRRSVRWFEPKPVSRDLIDNVLSVGIQAPSACNRQPFRFVVLDEPRAIAEVASIPMGTKGYEHQIPVFIVVVGQQRHFQDPRDRHLIYIDASLAVMGALFAAESLGLGACCINWPDIPAREQAMKEHLGLEDDERPVMCLAIGYPLPEALVASSPKKELDELRSYRPAKKEVESTLAAGRELPVSFGIAG